jgi:periplasmic divalent cation tolerance protein
VEALAVLTTLADVEAARQLVRKLVDERLVACGNIIPGVESIYRWKDVIETGAEVLVVLKTTADTYEAVARRISELHPYDVPEVIALPISRGAAPYMDWLCSNVNL